jgi:hypothetical protein
MVDGDRKVLLLEIPLVHNDRLKDDADDPERREYVVPAQWKWTVSGARALPLSSRTCVCFRQV